MFIYFSDVSGIKLVVKLGLKSNAKRTLENTAVNFSYLVYSIP